MDSSQIQFCFDKSQIDFSQVQNLFILGAFWAKERSIEDIKIAVENSDPVVTVWDCDRIIGFAISTDENDKESTHFEIKGEVRERFVILALYVKDQSRLGYQCLLLEVVSDGNTMEGYRNVYGILMKQIRSVKCTLVRHVNHK